MIKKEELIKIGQFNKPHGIKGELSFTFHYDIFDDDENCFLICELDGIFVPFTLEKHRLKSDVTAFVKLKGVDSDIKAKLLTNLDVYFHKENVKNNMYEDNISWDYFVGYKIIDELSGDIGEIIDVDETTINTLFIVKKENEELLIPAVEDVISTMDEENKILYVSLPEGLIDL